MILKFPELLGTNAKFILNESIPHFENGVIKLHDLDTRAFAGYIFGGIRALMPNNGLSYPSEYIFKVYINPDNVLPVELISFISSVSNRNVYLNWSTSSEHNNSGFDIERSEANSNLNEWIKAGSVRGYGNTNSVQNYLFEDKNLSSGKYRYRLKQIDYNGNFEYFNLSTEIAIGVPEKFYLSQNYPNPFNPSTNLEFGISEFGFVSLKVYDVHGKEVATLVNENKPAGIYEVKWNRGGFASGVYFYRIEINYNEESNIFSETKKMFLVK
jgi:hypothetical protein